MRLLPVVTLIVSALASLPAIGAAQDAPPVTRVSSEDGAASIQGAATVRAGTVRFEVLCPVATYAVCEGEAKLRTAGKVPVRRGGTRRVVVIARGAYTLQPGQKATLTAPVSAASHYYLSRRSARRVVGVVFRKAAMSRIAVGDVALRYR